VTDTSEILRERLQAMTGNPVADADVARLLMELLAAGDGVTLELEEGRWKLIRRDGRFVLKKDDARARQSTMPPRYSNRPPR
jgi:hypothetical protein